MKFFLFSMLLFSSNSWANPLFTKSHLVDSPYSIPKGSFLLGSSVGVGVSSFASLETQLISDFFQIYNLKARFSVWDNPSFALGLSLSSIIFSMDQSKSHFIYTLQPGGSFGLKIFPRIAWFLGGNFLIARPNQSLNGFQRLAYFQGAQIQSDLNWAYSEYNKMIIAAIAAGISYSFTYQAFGFGISHHWQKIRLGVHYYPKGKDFKIMPILGIGASVLF